MERNQQNCTAHVLSILERGGSIVKLKENLLVFDENGFCLFKISSLVLMGVLKDGRTETIKGESATEYQFLKSFVITQVEEG